MSVTLGKSPLLLDAASDEVGNDGKQWFVTQIRFVIPAGGGTGQFSVLDKSGGRRLYETADLAAGEAEDWHVDSHMDGVFISALPTGGRVYIYYK